MNCIRCGRRIAEGKTFCDECAGVVREPLPDSPYTSLHIALPKRTGSAAGPRRKPVEQHEKKKPRSPPLPPMGCGDRLARPRVRGAGRVLRVRRLLLPDALPARPQPPSRAGRGAGPAGRVRRPDGHGACRGAGRSCRRAGGAGQSGPRHRPARAAGQHLSDAGRAERAVPARAARRRISASSTRTPAMPTRSTR